MLLGLTIVDVDIFALHLVIIHMVYSHVPAKKKVYSHVQAAIIGGLPDHAKQTGYLSESEPKTHPIMSRFAKAGFKNAMWPCRNCTPGWFSLLHHMQDHLQQNLTDAIWSGAMRALRISIHHAFTQGRN